MRPEPERAKRLPKLLDYLAAERYLTRDEWREALSAVPRDLFIPRRAWAAPDGPGDGYPIDRDARPAEWWDAVYSDTSIITQMDDGATDPVTGEGTSYTSSASAPGVLVDFLDYLYEYPGHRALDIGTGTGWTAALLAARLGAANVTSIEIDPEVAAHAAANLKGAGLAPHLIVGDGAIGAPDRAPFDRVHVTYGISSVPPAWLEQTRPGGKIVAPWSPGYGFGHKLVLDVVSPRLAQGRLVGSAGYMPMRSQRYPAGSSDGFLHHRADAARSDTAMDPRTVVNTTPGADLVISALVPGVRRSLGTDNDSDAATLWLLETHAAAKTDGSWALVEYEPGRDRFAVEQYGPRHLWDEVSAAYLRWIDLGRPARDRFGVTVTPDGQRIWLDRPDGAL